MPKSSSSSIYKLDGEVSPPTYSVEEDEDGKLLNRKLKVTFPDRPERGKYSLADYMKNKKKGHRCSLSPPTYRVEEDSHGNLVSRNFKVVYPQLPKKGPYSLSQYMKKKKEAEKRERSLRKKQKKVVEEEAQEEELKKQKEGHHENCQCTCGDCCCSADRHRDGSEKKSKKDVKQGKTDHNNKREKDGVPIPRSLRDIFLGAKTAKEVETVLQPTQFLLYYRRPAAIRSIDDVPLSVPLTIAYMSSNSVVSHYPVKHIKNEDDKKMWRVDFGEGPTEQPRFFSLGKLIQFYKVFAVHREESVDFFRLK